MNAITRIHADDAAENPRAVIGSNGAPEPTPFEKSEAEVSKLYDEAALWLDGATVDSQELADGIANLLNMIRAAEKAADAARKADKEPHLKAGQAVDAAYKPILEKAKLATDACKKALAPWLEKLEAEKRAAAEKARQDADEKRRAAEAAIRARDAANLEQAAAAEALLKEAQKAERAATKAENDGAKAGNGQFGRAVSLRTIHAPVMTDPRAAVLHYWAANRDEMTAILQGFAERDVRAGKRDIPGFEIRTEQKAV
ncbi:hypothetical protein [Azospirillum tabaci]|uniref:hypothetical protein n=1 Tax=Azospirillum tabaci TaxID=2752310 RepID=UPI0016617434|nr:hypothetical protein [Azospirillum tabaci]